MSYTHLTKTELVFIEEYYYFGLNGRKIAKRLKRGHETIYRILRQLKKGLTAFEIHLQYQVNKGNCGRRKIKLPDTEVQYINEKVQEDWTPDVIIGRKAADIEKSLNQWLGPLPTNLFKSIIFDCGKEFSNWKTISNQQDIDIYFADPGIPSQRGLNEHSNGLLRRNGLPKEMDFNPVSQDYISKVVMKRNNIPRKSLNYQTRIEYFTNHVYERIDKSNLSRLI